MPKNKFLGRNPTNIPFYLEQCYTILSLYSLPILENRTTPRRTKTNSLHVKKTISATTISPIISRRSTYFLREAPSFMFDRILNVTLSNNFSKLEEGLRRSFPPLVLGILYSSCLLMLIPYTKTTRWNLTLTLRPYFLEGELIDWLDETINVWITVTRNSSMMRCSPCAPGF